MSCAEMPAQATVGTRGISPQAPARVPTPNNTPRKNGAALNDLIRSLEAEWQLGLQARDDTWSPSRSTDGLAEKVCGQLKRLHYSNGPELERALGSFRIIAEGFERGDRLKVLHGTLKSQIIAGGKSPGPRTGTPGLELGIGRDGNENRAKPLHFAPTTSHQHQHQQPSQSPGDFQILRGYELAPDPGSPTDDDEEYVTPQSPTLSSRSAQRRVQASPRFQLELSSVSKKRSSDSSLDAIGNSPKLTKTAKGKQPSDTPPDPRPQPNKPPSPVFKKPSRETARSFQQAPSTKSSFTNSSFNTMSSSQQTQPDTVMTSFTSDAYEVDVRYPKLTRTSSATMGSLDDQDLLNVDAQLEREITANNIRYQKSLSQSSERESSSTFGSIDEDGLVETSFRVESEFAVPPIIPPSRGTSVEQYWSPTKEKYGYSRETPTRSFGQSVQNAPANESPSRLPYYIRDIPEQNLFVEVLPEELRCFPYFVLFICCRLANEHDVTMRKLMSTMDPTTVRESACFWETVESQLLAKEVVRDPDGVWPAAKRDFDGFTFKGKITFKSSGHVFGLQLTSIAADKSCRFQRKFGSHRFLYLTLPSFETAKPDRFTTLQMGQIQEQFKTWFDKEHLFLGRKWRAFHIEPIKSKKKGKAKDNDQNADKRMVMFATEGLGIDEPISIGEMLDWFFPFAANSFQSFCKAYARVDLGLSRTIPTLAFKPSQIRFVRDIKADGTPESTEYNDSRFAWDERGEENVVMNDGCSRMSVGAASEIWKRYKKAANSKEAIPSVFQGRIGGAKGMWMACGEPSTNDPDELEIWIEITDSQLKFQAHDEDRHDKRPYDPHRLTFEYVSHSSSPSPSELHISFIPIMVDRGVPQKDIAELMINRLNVERDELLETLSDPVKIYHWVHQQSSTDDDPHWQASLPQSLPNKFRHLLQSGFYPKEEPYLANVLYRYVKQRQIWIEQKLKVSLGKATFLYGVADPLGVLEPGEVHVDFSTPFVDEITGGTYRALNNMDILVARQPACRRSDMQKVRAVKKPELSHLVDVVVFPSRGEFPLAGKLQGGDYDGDTFWLCWEPILVKPFKNAPAPLRALNPEYYGIQKDSRKLREVMNPKDLSTVDSLLRKVLDFRLAPSLLGLVTNFLEKQAYKENRMYSDRLNALCDMHDLLVDAPKNGYSFSKSDWTSFIRYQLKCGAPKVPAYKQAMEDCENAKELGEADKVRVKNYKHKTDNVLDYLYFEIVRSHDVTTLESVKEALPKEISDDADLQFPYLQLKEKGSEAVKEELAALVQGIKELDSLWTQLLVSKNGQKDLKSDHYNRTLERCYTRFRSLLPSNPFQHHDLSRRLSATHDPHLPSLLHPYLHHDFHLWEYIRASAAYTELPRRHAFVWHMAGRELAKLKCARTSGAVYVTGNIFANLKPKTLKVPRPEYEEEGESDDEFTSAKESLKGSLGVGPSAVTRGGY